VVFMQIPEERRKDTKIEKFFIRHILKMEA